MRVNKWLVPTLALILMLGTVGIAQANGWWIEFINGGDNNFP